MIRYRDATLPYGYGDTHPAMNSTEKDWLSRNSAAGQAL
jgi:hypothetical protein